MLLTPVNSNMLDAGAPIQNSYRVKYQHTLQESNASSLLQSSCIIIQVLIFEKYPWYFFVTKKKEGVPQAIFEKYHGTF